MDDAIKSYLLDLDRAIVARGGQSIYAPKPRGKFKGYARHDAFWAWENEKLEYAPRDQDKVRSRGRVIYRKSR